MGQLLMTTTLTGEKFKITLPEGFRTHQFRRVGDSLYSYEEFRSQWMGIRDPSHSEKTQKWFSNLYDDPRVPDDGFFLVIRGENELVASANIQIAQRTPDSATVHEVYALEACRGLGLGKAVVQQVLNYAIDHGIQKMFLTTDDWRIPAIAVYLKLGFVPVFYEPDMRERWTKICSENNFKNVCVINENEQNEIINAL